MFHRTGECKIGESQILLHPFVTHTSLHMVDIKRMYGTKINKIQVNTSNYIPFHKYFDDNLKG